MVGVSVPWDPSRAPGPSGAPSPGDHPPPQGHGPSPYASPQQGGPPPYGRPDYGPPPWEQPTGRPDLAEPLSRLLARLVDLALSVAVLVAAVVPFAVVVGSSEAAGGLLLLAGAVAFLAFLWWDYVYLVGARGQSVGKRLVGVRVVRAGGAPMTQGVSWGRFGTEFLAGFVPLGSLLDAVWCTFDDRRQCLHDKLVDTVVLRA